MNLVIISHTKHYKNEQDVLVGWGPTINEINYLANHFTTITHVGMFYDEKAPQSALPYTNDSIQFVSLPKLGGKTITSKLAYLFATPKIISVVLKELQNADAFQLRTPTGIAVFLIPFLTLFSRKKGWYKYAGNWVQKDPSLSYRFQRWMLKKQPRKVTINGTWKDQPNHCKTFENPCLTALDREKGGEFIQSKRLTETVDFCFVGGLNANKGILSILNAFKNISSNKIGTFHIIGDGALRDEVEKESKKLAISIRIHGSLSKEKVIEVYKHCHFLILASINEGFPKVIGEAMNYGCIPIASDISCIGQYIQNTKNGFLIQPVNSSEIQKQIENSLDLSIEEFNKYLNYNYELANKFTYQYYLENILKLIA